MSHTSKLQPVNAGTQVKAETHTASRTVPIIKSREKMNTQILTCLILANLFSYIVQDQLPRE